MARHTVCFATSGNFSGGRARWQEPVEAAWPESGGVEFAVMGIDPLIARLEAGSAEDLSPQFASVFVVLGPTESTRTVDRLLQALGGAGIPGVCLVQDPALWRPFQSQGVIFDSLDASAATVAAMLYALSERQAAVEVLSKEVAIAHRCQGGIRSEMDRIHEELHLAAAIQREFTSAPLPRIAGLDFGVLFRPVNFVSGDIYNVRDLGDSQAAFFMADAVGHGVPAALLTMVLTSSLTTTRAMPGQVHQVLEPAEVLRQLNDRLCQSCLGSGRFATALYGVVDGKTRTVKVAGAGHPWPLVVSPRGAREVQTDGPLLGVFPGAEFTQATIQLEDDEAFLLYTDGFESMFPYRTAERDDEWGGRDYLREMTRLVRTGVDIPHSLSKLEELLDEQSGSLHQADDITALVITPVGQSSVLPRSLAA